MNKFSVVILTFNEEINIESCIESVSSLSDDTVVLDSHSSDSTVRKASNLGARIIYNKFLGYASQRNFALSNIEYKNHWLIMLDADERATPEFIRELGGMDDMDSSLKTMFQCRRKDFFMGKWLKHSSGYPTWFPRVFKIGHCKVVREINEQYETSGEIGRIHAHLDHYPFNKGLAEWFGKHNRYSSMEADLLIEKKEKLMFLNLFSRDFASRRKAQKELVYRLPFRPLAVFFIFYVLRGGFLDGKAGWYFCLMRLMYEMLITFKVNEKLAELKSR